MAKEFLSKNNIHFIEKDINLDREASNELSRRKIDGVPTFFIGEDIVVGFDKVKILKLIDHRVVECPVCHTKMRVPIDKSNISIKCPKCKNKIEYK